MKKKIKVVSTIFLIILFLLGLMYTIDMNRMKNNESVVFSTWGYDYAPPIHINEIVDEPNLNEISVDGYSEFEISVKESDKIENRRILNNTDLYKNNSDYNLYYYGLDEVNVNVDDKLISLEEALKSGKITLDKIISNANNDLDSEKITGDMYKDGGSMVYKYDTYTIIKKHTLSGNRDMYIGIPEMTIQDTSR